MADNASKTKQASTYKGYNNIIAVRIRELMKSSGTTQQELAEKTGCSRQAIAQYADGSNAPNIDKLVSIAKYFDVSLDYLVGLSNALTADKDIQYICDYTGLSEKSIDVLHKIALQANGNLISDKRKEKADKLKLYIDNPLDFLSKEDLENDRLLFEQYKKDINRDSNIPVNNFRKSILNNDFLGFLNYDEKEDLEYILKTDQEEAKLIFDTIDYLTSKKDFYDFILTIYYYLFAEIEIAEDEELDGKITGGLLNGKSDIPIQIDYNLLIESFLLKINNYLNNWKDKGRAEIYSLECN